MVNSSFEQIEVELVMRSGHSKWVEAFPSMITRKNEIQGIQIIARDITERKESEIAMRKKLMKFDVEQGNI